MNNCYELVFKDKNGFLVVITESVTKELQQYRQLGKLDPEAAGVLIGERRGDHLIITDISIPGLGDIRLRCLVNRKGKHHQQKVDDCFIESGGINQYIGEWHTHPEYTPKPSFQDRCSWFKNLVYVNPMIVIIVGTHDIWVGKKTCNSIERLVSC